MYDIAIGTDRKATNTRQEAWEWKTLVQRLKKVEVCEHTLSQYKAMSKAQRVEAKDVGFFIGGSAKKRKVSYRQLIALDIDHVEPDSYKLLREWISEYTYIFHSTHSSTPEEPRYRVVVPLDRIVNADEYSGMLRILSKRFGIPIDVSTLDFNRIMFFPSIPKDATYHFETQEKRELEVDVFLRENKDWKDLDKVDIKVSVQDPTKKGGMIGAFCKKYSIIETLDTFLPDIWKKENDGTYTFIGASTVKGGKIYENMFLVSFHSTDPFMGRSHNAYDAVRLYKFGEGKAGDAAMTRFCEALGLQPEANKSFTDTLDSLDDDSKTLLKEHLELDKNGALVKSLKNAEYILRYDPELQGVFGYDLFSEMPVLKRMPYWRANVDVRTGSEDCINVQAYEGMEDVDESYLRLHFEKAYGYDARANLTDALNITAHKNSFHPVREYLESLEWDGVPRLERIFIDCFGVPESQYSREVGLKFFVGAVRRVFIPASKMDYIPVLVSEEGLGKSKFIRRMAKMWGSDTFYTFNGSKEAYEQLRGVWLMEIPELNGIQNRSTNSRKAFVTKGEDRYRSAYLKYTKTYKRQCVFIASSNDVIFLDDPSEDGRRWWGLMCNATQVKINVHDESFLTLVDHYWAEAVHHYKMGVLPVLTLGAEVEAKMLRQVHKAENIEEGALIDYLNMPVPHDWYEMSVFERKHYWENSRPLWRGEQRDAVCTTEVAREFFGLSRMECTPQQGRKIGDALRATGLFIQDGRKQRFGEYGTALAWVRKSSLVSLLKKSRNDKGLNTDGY